MNRCQDVFCCCCFFFPISLERKQVSLLLLLIHGLAPHGKVSDGFGLKEAVPPVYSLQYISSLSPHYLMQEKE